MKNAIAIYYVILVVVLLGQFVATLWIKSVGVQQATQRTMMQRELAQLHHSNEISKRQLSDQQSIATIALDQAQYVSMKTPIALTQADQLLAAR